MSKTKEASTPNWVKNLRRLMAGQSFNPRSLSLAAGLNATAVRDMIEGRSRYPRYDTVLALSKALKTTPAQLMGQEKGKADRKKEVSQDIQLLTEIIVYLQETAQEMGRDLEPREFAAMSTAIYRRLQDETNISKQKSRSALIKPQVRNLMEYESLRHKHTNQRAS